MFSTLPLRQQYGMIALAGLAMVALFGLGGHYLRQPAPIISEPLPSSTPTVPQAQGVVKELPAIEVVVHVAGAVKNPTVVTMHPGNRVHDAISAAGGLLPDADLNHVNLAAKLVDGTQLYIPHLRESGSGEIASAYRGGRPASSYDAVPSTASQPVNLNSAGLAELDTLPGIGPSTAQKILDYREAHGPFKSVDELLAVPSIGPTKLDRIRPLVIL